MSAYGNLASARTDIGRNLSDIAGIGIEMEYGSEGRIAGQMEQSRIQRQTEAIGLGLESIQQVAGLGKSAAEEAARAKEMGALAGGYEQTKGETRLWDLFRGKADIDTGGGETFWGEVGERIGTGLGFMDREYQMGGRTYTSSQIEAGIPYAKLGKNWEEVSQLMGGGTEIPGRNEPEAIWEGSFEDLGMTESEFDSSPRRVRDYNVKPLGGITDERTNVLYDEEGKPFKYIDETIFDNSTTTPVTTSPYDITPETELSDLTRWRDKGLADYQGLINKAMYGRDWDAAAAEWKNIRKGYLK